MFEGTLMIFLSPVETLPIMCCPSPTMMKWTLSKYAPFLSAERLLLTAHIAPISTTTYKGSSKWRVQAFVSHCHGRFSDKAWICVARKWAKLRRGREKMPQEVRCIWTRDLRSSKFKLFDFLFPISGCRVVLWMDEISSRNEQKRRRGAKAVRAMERREKTHRSFVVWGRSVISRRAAALRYVVVSIRQWIDYHHLLLLAICFLIPLFYKAYIHRHHLTL